MHLNSGERNILENHVQWKGAWTLDVFLNLKGFHIYPIWGTYVKEILSITRWLCEAEIGVCFMHHYKKPLKLTVQLKFFLSSRKSSEFEWLQFNQTSWNRKCGQWRMPSQWRWRCWRWAIVYRLKPNACRFIWGLTWRTNQEFSKENLHLWIELGVTQFCSFTFSNLL